MESVVLRKNGDYPTETILKFSEVLKVLNYLPVAILYRVEGSMPRKHAVVSIPSSGNMNFQQWFIISPFLLTFW